MITDSHENTKTRVFLILIAASGVWPLAGQTERPPAAAVPIEDWRSYGGTIWSQK